MSAQPGAEREDAPPQAPTGEGSSGPAAAMGVVEVSAAQLPVFCPNPAMPLWSSHPRVFLHFDAVGEARCPYCGTRYHLAGGAAPAHR